MKPENNVSRIEFSEESMRHLHKLFVITYGGSSPYMQHACVAVILYEF